MTSFSTSNTLMTSADEALGAEGREATVIANLPNGLFRLRLAGGREVVAHPAQDMRMAFVRLVAGDVVRVDLSPFDDNKARICALLRRQRARAASRNPVPDPSLIPRSNPSPKPHPSLDSQGQRESS